MRPAALAVDDAHATHAPLPAVAQELADADRRHVPVHAVQIELVLDYPVAAPELAQHVAAEAFAEISELIARIHGVIEAQRSERFREHGALVAQALLGNCRNTPPMRLGA